MLGMSDNIKPNTVNPSHPPTPPEPLPWTVLVDDNFHYMDESHREVHSRHATLDEAIATAMGLTAASAGENGDGYQSFGEDPFIKPAPDAEILAAVLARHPEWPAEAFADGYFSAWNYAAYLTRKG